MTRLLRRLIAVFLFTSASAHAALTPDPTGYWYNPNESGWGVSIAQQGDVLFVTLLAYDDQKRPAWFVASRVTGAGMASGPLYRTTGPWFGAAFDPATVGIQAVGTLTLQATSQASLRLTYTVNGVEVTKNLARMTWDSNVTRFIGAYFGGMSVTLAFLPQPSGCPSAPTYFAPGTAFHINVADPSTLAIFAGEGIDLVTLIGGPYQQSGQSGSIAAGIFRGNVAAPIHIADAQITNLIVSDDGFSGHISITMSNCVYEGSIGGLRRAP